MNASLSYQLKWAWSLTKQYRARLLLYFILELLAIVLSLAFIYWSKNAIDFAVNQDLVSLKGALILSVSAVLLGLSLSTYGNWLNEKIRIKLLMDLQNQLISAQMLSQWEFVRKWKTGDIQVRVQSDCQEIVRMVGVGVIGAILTVIRLAASFGLMWVLDPMLALLIIAISPLFFFSKIYFRILRKLNGQLKEAESSFGHILLENLRFRNMIRALNIYPDCWRKVEDSQGHIIDLKMRLLNFSIGAQTLMRLAVNVGFLLTFIWGIYRLYTAEITFGTMAAYLQLVGRIQSPIIALMGFLPQFIRFRTAVFRVMESLQVEIEEEVEQEYVPSMESICIERLSFKYEDRYVIDDLSAEFVAGKPTAVLGYSGKGKTTLIRLLLMLLKPDAGQLKIRNQGEYKILSNAHRNNFAYVPQGDKLFSGTIRENLSVNNERLTEVEIQRALYLSCAEFVYDLPEGLDTYIGESGYGLSEGQSQRIAIARAMVRDCSIWLFDEITSALDRETGDMLIERLIEAGREKIIVFVTHDIHFAKKCSNTIFIK